MRRFIPAVVISLAFLSSMDARAECEIACPKTKVLFVVGGGFHDFKKLPPILKKDLEATGNFDVTVTDNLEPLSALDKSKTDVVLVYTQGRDLTPAQEKGLVSFVENGGGYAGIHSASDSFKNSDAYWKLVGGRFTGHGSGTFPVHFTVTRHDAVRGLSDFEDTDETYNHEFHKDAKILVLARRATDNEPCVWVQNYGKGRVFFTGLGHDGKAFNNPGFKALMLSGIGWAANAKAPAECARVGCCVR